MNIEELKKDQMKYYHLNDYNPQKIKISKLNYQTIITQLCFIIHYLIEKGYTLTHICINDFELSGDNIFLKSDNHIMPIDAKNHYIYKEIKSNGIKDSGICFPHKNLKDGHHASIHDTYASVGLFVYYLYFKKVMNELSEKDYGKLKGTKPYFFIKNTMSTSPCLIYL